MTLIKLLMTWKLKWVPEAFQHGACCWLGVNEHQCICNHHNEIVVMVISWLVCWITVPEQQSAVDWMSKCEPIVYCWIQWCVEIARPYCQVYFHDVMESGFIRIWYELSCFFSFWVTFVILVLLLLLFFCFSFFCFFFTINKHRPSITVTVVTWACHLKSPALRSRFVQQPFGLTTKIKDTNHRITVPLWGESADDRLIPVTKGQ